MEIEPRPWCETALSALLSLWDYDKGFALRSSESFATVDSYHPTATAHAAIALCESGIWREPGQFEDEVFKSSRFSFSTNRPPPSAADYIAGLLSQSQSGSSWYRAAVDTSSHSEVERAGLKQYRAGLAIDRLLHALCGALECVESLDAKTRERIRVGLGDAANHLIDLCLQEDEILPVSILMNDRLFSPYILLVLARSVDHLERLTGVLNSFNLTNQQASQFETLKSHLSECFERHIERQMARQPVQTDPLYDPPSLAFAVRGYTLTDRQQLERDFLAAIITAVVEGQHPDGCWPDGISVSYEPSGDVIQQPSVEIALALAESIIDPNLLFDHRPEDVRILQHGSSALEATANYLVNTYTEVCRDNPDMSGWTSDRVRWPGTSETWITALAVRLFNKLWCIERIERRTDTLSSLGVEPVEFQWNPSSRRAVRRQLVDPDGVVEPVATVWKEVVELTSEARARGQLLIRPPQGAASFIVFGPPGSGKTYLVRKIAQAIGWPLVELNPGHFITEGLERIEATTRELFQQLLSLEHAVVLMDECDELFRERSFNDSANRNILSFATASMLPKLQKLHDERTVLLFLATNYLSRIDHAIRRPGRFDYTLLFDRPDAGARRRLFESSRVPKDADLDELVTRSAGLTVTEVINLVSSGRVLRGTRDDYCDWCKAHGKDELEASRLEVEEQRAIRERWDGICKGAGE